MIPMVTFRLRDFSDESDMRICVDMCICVPTCGPWAAKPGFDLRLFRVMVVRFCKV